MSGTHFGVKTLLFACGIVGIALGTVVTQWAWLSAVFDFFVWATLAAALTAALVASGPLRVFGRGCAVWGALYFWMAFTDTGQELPGPHIVVERLAEKVHEAGAHLYMQRLAGPDESITIAGPNMYRIGATRIFRVYGDEWEVSRRTMQGLATLTFGLIGGWAAAWISYTSSDKSVAKKQGTS
jgi:hypothetical protein